MIKVKYQTKMYGVIVASVYSCYNFVLKQWTSLFKIDVEKMSLNMLSDWKAGAFISVKYFPVFFFSCWTFFESDTGFFSNEVVTPYADSTKAWSGLIHDCFMLTLTVSIQH